MGAMGDLANEFKSAPTGGKVLLITAVVAVAGMGLYVASVTKNANSGPNVNGSLIPIGDGSGDSGNIATPPSTPVTPVTPVTQPPRYISNPPMAGPITIAPPMVGPITIVPPKPVVIAKPPTKPIAQKYVTVQKWVTGGYNEMSTLSAIAQKYYGNASKWTVIYNANRNIIKDPNLVYAGERLLLPGL